MTFRRGHSLSVWSHENAEKVVKRTAALMKVTIFANVDKDWRQQIRTPYGMTQFRSYISRNFVTADLPYTHESARAVEGDTIVWAFRDENQLWHLLGDGIVVLKEKVRNRWEYHIEGARLYPRTVALDELKNADRIKKALNIGYDLKWDEYEEVLRKASTPLVS